MSDVGEAVRERIVRNAIEHAEFRYAKFVSEKGKEGAVFGFNLLDPFGRTFAESHVGKEAVDRFILHYDPAEVTPAFWFVCGLADAEKMIEAGYPDAYRVFKASPAPDGHFLVIGVSHDGILPRWLPKPAA